MPAGKARQVGREEERSRYLQAEHRTSRFEVTNIGDSQEGMSWVRKIDAETSARLSRVGIRHPGEHRSGSLPVGLEANAPVARIGLAVVGRPVQQGGGNPIGEGRTRPASPDGPPEP